MSFEEIHAFLFPSVSVAHRLVQYTKFNLLEYVLLWLDWVYQYICINRSTLKRLWKPFIIIWTTWYNLRKCAVEHSCKFSAIHVKNTYQSCNCFLHECLASFLKQDGVKFRQWSAITRKLSYPLWSDGNRTLLFQFWELWLALKTFLTVSISKVQ